MFSLSVLVFSLLPLSHALSPYSAANSTGANVIGPVSQLYVGNKYVAPDGFNRSATLVNGAFPGPLIQANKNDPFAVQVINQLTDDTMALETSVHWHGIFQHKSNWADGVSYITQCPIRQQKSFTSRFIPVNQTGTYWYHSHYSTQYCDGLRGPIVIYDPEDPLAYLYDVDDASTVITLSDWYHQPTSQLNDIVGRLNPNSTLINGAGRYPGGPSVPLSVIDVQPGLRYRLRIVGLSCSPSFNFTIDGHRMTIIEADGNEVVPVDVDWLQIFSGQRYSVVITANQPVANYWIRAPTNLSPSLDGGQSSAILRYAGAPEDQDPTSTAGPYELAFDEGALHPLINPGVPGVPEIGEADVTIQLPPGQDAQGTFTLGNASFAPPSIPVLLQILSGAVHPAQLLPSGSVYTLPPNKVIEISFPNPTAAPGGPHPMHLHGHPFDVVRVSGSNTTNFVNPVRRDVVSMGENPWDNVTIRFVTDNPGPWFLHCHIDWHLNHGFAVVMAEAPEEAYIEQSAVVPEDWEELCQDY